MLSFQQELMTDLIIIGYLKLLDRYLFTLKLITGFKEHQFYYSQCLLPPLKRIENPSMPRVLVAKNKKKHASPMRVYIRSNATVNDNTMQCSCCPGDVKRDHPSWVA